MLLADRVEVVVAGDAPEPGTVALLVEVDRGFPAEQVELVVGDGPDEGVEVGEVDGERGRHSETRYDFAATRSSNGRIRVGHRPWGSHARSGHPQRRSRRRHRAPPAFVGDVAVDGGVITEVGRRSRPIDGRGRTEIDATGLLVTPGFVDIHTHYDGQVTWDPTARAVELARRHHVVMGNCGVGFAPVQPDRQRVAHRADGRRRGHPRHRARRGHPVGLGDVPRVPRRPRRAAARASTSARRCRTARCAAT